ncbi:MAG: VOC family protein [Ferruginibacter sp.]|nr:VOC family protein [Chitinophagaceae bacterium]
MLQKLRTVIYHVKDLQAAKEWYAGVTGVQPYFDEAFYVGFDINGCELGLDPSMDNIATGNHTVSYWAVESTKEVSEKFLAAGASLVQGVTNVGGPIHVAIVADPFGNHIGFIEGA